MLVLKNTKRRKMIMVGIIFAMVIVAVIMCSANFSFAADEYQATIREILEQMIGIIGVIFQAVGVVLCVYAVGSLVLAFKNDDANAKSSSSTLLVVGVVLIAIPGIINALGLVSRIGN